MFTSSYLSLPKIVVSAVITTTISLAPVTTIPATTAPAATLIAPITPIIACAAFDPQADTAATLLVAVHLLNLVDHHR